MTDSLNSKQFLGLTVLDASCTLIFSSLWQANLAYFTSGVLRVCKTSIDSHLYTEQR